jgi:hypothetical protein
MSNTWYFTLIIGLALVCLLVCVSAPAADQCAACESKEALCLKALSACQDVVKQEDDARVILQKQVYNAEERQLDEQTAFKHSDTLWFLGGILLGGFITYTLRK